MRLPNGFVNHSRQRLARVLSARRGGRRLAHGLAAPGRGRRLAGVLAARSQRRLEHLLAKHSADRLARGLVVGLVILMGGGAAAALAVLPSDRGATGAAGAVAASGAVQSHRIAVGELVAQAPAPRRAGPSHYRKIVAKRVSASTASDFMALYREAARTFGVSWRLLASVHRQETAFSTASTTYHGLNAFGCCAGPMQFNVTNGPPSTWALYRYSYRLGNRPSRYPHPTRRHPSIYDDFDAMMAAGALLRDAGADGSLGAGSWSAAYAYYGHDLYGIEYASEVLGRARTWERDGFCANCAADPALVAHFEDAYGVDARRQLLSAEQREKQEKKRRERKKKARAEARRKQARAEARRKAERERAQRKKPRRSSPGERRRPAPAETPGQTTPEPAPSTATPTTTTEVPPAAPPPAPAACEGLKRLLGCG